ncbi:unnamed protein product, partial [Parascedosporium putredinis]
MRPNLIPNRGCRVLAIELGIRARHPFLLLVSFPVSQAITYLFRERFRLRVSDPRSSTITAHPIPAHTKLEPLAEPWRILTCADPLYELVARISGRILHAMQNANHVPRVLALRPPCLVDGLQAGNCSLFDFETLPSCSCTNIPLQASISACVQTSCHFDDQAKTSILVGQICAPFPRESRRDEVKAAAIACLVLTVVVVFLRCLSRFAVSSRLWWDDWTTLLATALLIALTSVKIAGAGFGFGLHYWNVNPANAETIFQLFYTAQMLYILIQVTAKVSILILFWRIFTVRWFRITVWCCVTFLIIHGLLFLLLIAFHDPSDTDLEILKLQLTIQKKIAVCLMFAIGSFACVTSMVRLKYLVTFANSLDATWDNVDIVIWSIIEVTCAIICGSLPTLRPLLQKVPGFLTSMKSSQYGMGGLSGTSGTGDRSQKYHSEVMSPGGSKQPSQPGWDRGGPADWKHIRNTSRLRHPTLFAGGFD